MTEHCLLLEARNLGRRHRDGTQWLLKDISIEIRPGQRLALAGPSGAGKTLLLRALATLDPLDLGEIRWKGASVAASAIPAYRSRVVYLHQRPEPVEGTVEQVLRQPFELRVHRDKKFDRARVVDCLEALGRDGSFLAKLGNDLSGGEEQIVMLVRTLQLEPEVLLLDEPTAALDSRTTEDVERLLARWVRDGQSRAYFWVSHDSEQARRVADVGLRLERDGPTWRCLP